MWVDQSVKNAYYLSLLSPAILHAPCPLAKVSDVVWYWVKPPKLPSTLVHKGVGKNTC